MERQDQTARVRVPSSHLLSGSLHRNPQKPPAGAADRSMERLAPPAVLCAMASKPPARAKGGGDRNMGDCRHQPARLTLRRGRSLFHDDGFSAQNVQVWGERLFNGQGDG